MKRKSRRKSNGRSSLPVVLAVIVVAVVGIGVLLYFSQQQRQICVVDTGDVVCMDDELSNLKRYEFPAVNGEAKAISAAPGNKYFIVDPGTEFRDDPLDLYDNEKTYMGTVDLPTARYDMLKIQWTSDGSKAYIMSDIGVLYEFDPATRALKQLTEDRANLAEGEDFSQNKRGFIVDYVLLSDNQLALTVQNYETFSDYQSELYGPQNDTRLFVMNTDGSDVRRLGNNNRIVAMSAVNNNQLIYSVQPGKECRWGDECRVLYTVNVDSGEEELVAGKNLEFRNFTYDDVSGTLFLTRGAGGSAAEVYYGPLNDFADDVQKIKLDTWTGSLQGNLSLIPLGGTSLAMLTGYDGSGVVEKFDLTTGDRVSSIDAPAINFDGVEQLVQNWQP